MVSFSNSIFSTLKKKVSGILQRPHVADEDKCKNTGDELEIIKVGNAAVRREDFQAAVDLYAPLVQTRPRNSDFYISYGYALLKVCDFAKAQLILKIATDLDPESADAHYMLGKAYIALNNFSAAEQSWDMSHRLSPKIESLYCDFCLLLFTAGKINQARSLLKSGIENFPLNSALYFYLGNLDAENADYAEAAMAYKKAMDLDPTSPHLLSNYGTALRQIGNLSLSTKLTKKALELAPEVPSIFSNYLFGIQYSPDLTKEEKFKEHIEYAAKFETPFIAKWGNYKNDTKRDRKIRIGYVSGDFRNHSLIFFIAPILKNHDKSQFEVYCYYSYPFHDADSERIKQVSDQWLACHEMSDDELEARIRTDEIDILVDLSGHTGNNRLPVFARKPAPIQMTWLGYQSTTGLSAIDYRVTEEALDPTGCTEALHSEKLLRLPSSGTFSPCPDSPPVNALPALSKPVFTFGCLNNPSKITDESIALWSQILIQTPASRLLIGYSTPALIEKLSAKFSTYNVPSHQVLFEAKVGMREYLQLHHQIDLALDTFPYNGGTTTFHSLWMGVPILALEGDTALSKVGASVMSGLGLSQFCCTTKQRYVDQAVTLATQLAELAAVRRALRPQMAVLLEGLASSVTQNLENAFEKCWAEYREARLEELANEAARQTTLN